MSDTLWVENFDEIALPHTVKEIEDNLCFAILGKNSKIPNGRHFWGGENFLKIAKSNPIQAINPINLHAKFGKDRIRTVA